METSNNDLLPIPLKSVETEKRNVAKRYFLQIEHSPVQQADRLANSSPEVQVLLKQMLAGKAGKQSVSILDSLKKLSGEIELLTPHSNTVANIIATGFGIGAYLAMQYDKSSGLSTLRQQNSANTLAVSQKTEFEHKQQTAAAICIFTAAYYITSELSRYESEEVNERVIPHIGLPEFTLLNIQTANRCVLFHYGTFLASTQIVPDDVALVRYTIDYFEEVLKEIELYKSSLKYTEEFENRSYKLEDSEFVVRGFKPEIHDGVKSIEFKRVQMEQIVGNRDAKHFLRRLIMKLLCYSIEEKRNSMQELGGMPRITMGKGYPGTGKSLLIAAGATELSDRCKDLKKPFLFHPFPSNIVSEYQGGSAQRAMDWWKPQRDTGKIIYAPIDDAENNFPNRGSRNISAGNKEVISVSLTETEGSHIVYRGNVSNPIFTNRPEDLDPAWLSRIEERTDIDGAKTWHDFVDQEYLYFQKYADMMPGVINIENPDGYTYMSSQRVLKSLSEDSTLSYDVPKHPKLIELYDQFSGTYSPGKSSTFYGKFFEAIRKPFPFITSRDLKNIQTAVSKRMMDFDFPEEWWNDLDLFFTKKCDIQKPMLIDLMKENMKGLSFGQIRLQEAVRYLDTTVVVYETTFETSVKQRLEEMKVFEEAKVRFQKSLTS